MVLESPSAGYRHSRQFACFPAVHPGVYPQRPNRGHGVVSRSAEQKQKVYYPRVSAEAEDVRYTIRGFGVLIKNDFEV